MKKLNETERLSIQYFLGKLDPPTQNNKRKYWRRKLEKYYETKSESLAREIEEEFGESPDFEDGSDQDYQRGEPIS